MMSEDVPATDAEYDYPTKRKTHNRLHPVIFLVAWSVVLAIGWVLLRIGIYDIALYLPESIRQMLSPPPPQYDSIYIDTPRPFIHPVILTAAWIALGMSQRYLLNRTFLLRLSRWWIVLTPLAYYVSFQIGLAVSALRTRHPRIDLQEMLFQIMVISVIMSIPAIVQWWLLRGRWRYDWLWMLGMMASGVLMGYIAIALWTPTNYSTLLILEGIAHGVVTGVTAIALDRLTRHGDYPPRKKQDVAG